MKICQRCNTHNSDDSVYCKKCNEKLSKIVKGSKHSNGESDSNPLHRTNTDPISGQKWKWY